MDSSALDDAERCCTTRDQINVTAIAPGAVASDMNRAARDHGEAVAQTIPNKRIGMAEDMAAAAIYLFRARSHYINPLILRSH